MSKKLSKCLGCGNEYYAGFLGFEKCTKCGDYAYPDLHARKIRADKEIYAEKMKKQEREKLSEDITKFHQAMYNKGYTNFNFVVLLSRDNFKLYVDNITKIIYIGYHEIGNRIGTNVCSLSPWYSSNGKIQRYIDGEIIEID